MPREPETIEEGQERVPADLDNRRTPCRQHASRLASRSLLTVSTNRFAMLPEARIQRLIEKLVMCGDQDRMMVLSPAGAMVSSTNATPTTPAPIRKEDWSADRSCCSMFFGRTVRPSLAGQHPNQDGRYREPCSGHAPQASCTYRFQD